MTVLLLSTLGCSIPQVAVSEPTPEPTAAVTSAAPTASPSPAPTETPSPTPTEEPSTIAAIEGFWTLTGMMQNNAAVDIRGKKIESYIFFSDDSPCIYYWEEIKCVCRYEGELFLANDSMVFLSSLATILLTYDRSSDTLHVQADSDRYWDAVGTEYIYSRIADAAIPSVNAPFLDSTVSDGIIGTWDLVRAEGKSDEAKESAYLINEGLRLGVYYSRYVFKENGSGLCHTKFGDSEDIFYYRYAAKNGSVRISNTVLAWSSGESFTYRIEEEELYFSDGDMTQVFQRYGSSRPI